MAAPKQPLAGNNLLGRGIEASGVLAAALGLVVLSGWYLQMPALARIFPGSVPVQPDTAIGLFACGAAILAGRRNKELPRLAFGGAAALLGLVALLAEIFLIDFQLNRLTLGYPADRPDLPIEKMSPPSTLSLVLAGISLALMPTVGRSFLHPSLMGLLGSVVFGLAAVASSGYFTGLTAAYMWGPFGGMALASGLGFMLVGFAIVALGWVAGTTPEGFTPRWLPWMVGACGLVATFILWQAFSAAERSRIEQVVRHEAINIHNHMASRINSAMFDALRMAQRWERHSLAAPERMLHEAELMLQTIRGLRAVGWVDPANRLAWLAPREEFPEAVGFDLSLDRRHKSAMDTARREGMALTSAGAVGTGDRSYFIYAPVGGRHSALGFLVAIFDSGEMLGDLIEDEIYIGYSIAVYDGHREIYLRRRSDFHNKKWTEVVPLAIASTAWTLHVWPREATMAALESRAPSIAWSVGWLMTSLFTALTYLAQKSRERASALELSNERLAREVSDRTRTAMKLRESEERYRELFEKARDSISLISTEGKFVAVNPAFEAMGGYVADEWIGRSFTEIIHPDDLPRILGHFQALLRGETIPAIELRFLTKRGVYRTGEVSASTRHRNGQIADVMAVVRDITERKLAERQLQLQLERISALREINAAVTSTLDLNAVLTVLFETMERLLPYGALQVWLWNGESGRLERTACWNLDERDWKERMLPGVPALMRLAMDTKAPVYVADIVNDPRTHDREFFRRNGLVSYLGAPLLAKDRALGVLVFLTREAHEFDADETSFLTAVASHAAAAIQNAQLYEKIERQARELEQANKAQADFAAMIAHDLRSPLSNIIGIAEMMHQGLFGEPSDDQKEWLNRMANNAKNLVKLVSDFLDVSKLESGRIELVLEDVDILELAENLAANYRPVAANKQIALSCRGEGALPLVWADARRLDQVLTNLLSNALKFTSEGGKIEIAAMRDGDRLRVSVSDTGLGIPEGEIPGLFQKYRQAKRSAASDPSGTGLGLVICKMIVEAHGGEISIESEEGKGTSVNFTLPLRAQAKARANGETDSFPGAESRT